MSHKLTEAPAAAFQFASVCKFSDDGGDPQSKSKPIEILARTGDPVPHWFFGRIVHDFAGMTSRPTIAIDWNHDPEELIGKANQFDATSGDLIVKGSIDSIETGDCADKIIRRAAVGIPYEASIYFDPYALVLEDVPEGYVAEVNGRQVEGPLVIAREWQLRRIAITPSGVDGQTEVKFSAASEGATAFSLHYKEPQAMTKAPTTPEAAAPTTPEAALPTGSAPDARAQFTAELKRFTDKFGTADGATYFATGLNYEAALDKHLDKLTAANAAAEAAKLSAEQRLQSLNLGESGTLKTTEGQHASAGGSTPEGKTSFSSCFKAATQKANIGAS